MKVAIAALAFSAMLVGCSSSSMDDQRSAGPYKTLDSSKPVDKVAQCSESTWQSEVFFGDEAEAWMDTKKDGSFTVYTRSVKYFADVKPGGSGTTVSFYTKDSGSPMAAKRLAALATCL